MNEEEWKPIPNYDGYEASSLGRIRSYWDSAGNKHPSPKRIMSAKNTTRGYRSYRLRTGRGLLKHELAHRLIAYAFLGLPPNPSAYVCHNNGIKTDNRPENLRYDTPKANAADAMRHGTLLSGEHINTAKLIPELVVAIRYLFINKKASQRQLAVLFDMSRSQIGYIVRGESWKHLFNPPGLKEPQ